MAARNVKSPAVYESMDKLPSNTLKRHPKMDLNKNDLLRLLGYLEGELQARDVSIAALKAEKAKQLLYQAKYGRFGLGDPFHALQRDSDSHKDNSFDEAAVKAMYDNQLLQLENLIETQRKAQQRMREQLAAVEKRYHKVCAELEDEQRKHAQDTAQGDDVTYLLEKERERLKQELDFEKTQQKKLEKEVKKLTSSLEEERAMSAKHKQVAIFLIKERKKMVERVLALQQRSTAMENLLRNDKAKMDDMAEGLILESQKSLQMEAALEKQLSEFDVERQQLRHKLGREEARNEDLAAEVDSLRQRVERLMQHAGPELQALAAEQGFTPRGHAPPPVRTPGPAGPMATGPRFTPVRHPTNMQAHARTMASSTSPPPPGARGTPPEVRKLPIVHVRDSPERDGTPGAHPQTNPAATPSPSDPSGVKRVIRQFGGQPGVGVAAGSLPQGARSPERTPVTVERPHPSPASPAAHAHPHAHPHAAANDKPADLSNSRVNVIGAGGGGSVFTSPSGNTTVFTTPSGTRISLNVGPAGSSAAASATAAAAAAAPGSTTMIRKVGPAGLGRGVPPPVPPNKPQVYLPQQQQQHQQPPGAPSTQQPRKDNMVRLGNHPATGGPHAPHPSSAMASISSPPLHHRAPPMAPGACPRQHPPARFGITFSKDKITIMGPENQAESLTRVLQDSGMVRGAGVPPTAQATPLLQPGAGRHSPNAVRKPNQVCANHVQ